MLLYLHQDSTTVDFEQLIQLLTIKENLMAIQLACPYALTYLAGCLILSNPIKRSDNFTLKNLIKILINLRGPTEEENVLLKFLRLIYEEFDFDKAREQILKIKS